MSGKQWLMLLALFIAYLLVGAWVFLSIEQAQEEERHRKIKDERIKIWNALFRYCRGSDSSVSSELTDKLNAYCSQPVTNLSSSDSGPKTHWHYYNAVFFVLTVVSTIGYGNLSPTCALSRNIMIVYALVGIPINGILLKHMADFFGNFFLRAHDRYKKHRHEGRLGLISDILLYLIPGLIVFIIFPAAIFKIFEDWTFGEGIYFAFVTLTTIGFGDLVAGQTDDGDGWYVAYKIFLVLWVIFGLGYLVMLLGFITRAMRSKRMARLEHKLAHQIKQTHTKLWHGLMHETRFLRRALNELYLLKLKPVYRESGPQRFPHLCRSASAPELYHLPSNIPTSDTFGRPRALSEVLHMGPRGMPASAPLRRPRSESELSLIDRRATFADTGGPAELDPAELLHEFMSALVPDEPFAAGAGWRPAKPPAYAKAGTALPDGGVMGFPEVDILADERPRAGPRGRAASLAPTMLQEEEAEQEQWTWSGAAASKRIQELLRARNLRRRSVTAARQLQELQEFQQLQQLRAQHKQLQKEMKRKQRCHSTSEVEDPPYGSTLSLASNNDNLLLPGGPRWARWAPGARRSSLFTPTQKMPKHFGSRLSVDDDVDARDQWSPGLIPSKPSSRKISAVNMGRSTESAPAASVLETTSLADFLRVLQSVRAQAAAAEAAAAAPPPSKNKSRKLGTAHLQSMYPEVYDSSIRARPRSASSSGAESPRRKFSLWHSVFNSSQTVLPTAKQEKHRRLSSLFAEAPKKRRFSIWPSFGGKAPDVEAQTSAPTSPADVSAPTSPPPKITVSYVSEGQNGANRESGATGAGATGAPVASSGSLRRQALAIQQRLSMIPPPTMDASMRRPSPPANLMGSLDSSALFRRRANSDLPPRPPKKQ